MPIVVRGRQTHLRRVHVDQKVVDGIPASVSAPSSLAVSTSTWTVGAPASGVAVVVPGSAGSRAALTGLHAVESTQQQPRTFRQAVMGALVGLTALTGASQSLNAPAQTELPQSLELVLPRRATRADLATTDVAAGAPPPPPKIDPLNTLIVGAVSTSATSTGAHAGLADTLVALKSGMSVTHGSDPGDFYCEHAFFTSTTEALRPGSTVLKNASGEPLTAFLHNPSDKLTYDAALKSTQRERHADRREIVGAAIRGYYEAAKGQIKGAPFRMLITGYAQWGGVVNNPTGDFVSHSANVDAAMHAAFGDALFTSRGKANGAALEYHVLDPASHAPHMIIVEPLLLPVSDEAIDGGPKSLQQAMADFKPHAVLSMGVAGGSPTFLAEFHADNGGLAVVDGKQKHDDGKSPDQNQPDNYSLARALLSAGATGTAGIKPTLVGGV